MIGKTVMEVLPKIDRDIKIGTADGAGFFYCGKPLDEDGIRKMDCVLQMKARKSIEYSLDKFRTVINTLQSVDLYSNNRDVIKNLEFIKKTFSFIGSRQKTVLNAVKKYEEQIPFGSRKIVNVYPSCEGDDLIIIIEGGELGGYWTRREYEEGIEED
ncbi:MAG: hypothetical protein Q4C03_04235 [bacterium]|nr:hypothetical protein [bacterium]